MNEPLEASARAAVQLVRAADPAAEAAALAERLGADVAGDLPTAERLVRARVEAGREALGGTEEADADLLARAEAIRESAAVEAPIDDEAVGELERLASDLTRAARIRERTESRFSENLQARVAASQGVALHPAAILAAATAVIDAERILAGAEAAIAALGPEPGAQAEAPPPAPLDGHDNGSRSEDPVLRRPLDDFDEVALDKRRAISKGFAVFFILAGTAAITLGLGVTPAVAIALVAAAIVLGILVTVRGRRAASREPEVEEPDDTASLLASLPDMADIATLDDPDRPAPGVPDEHWVDRRVRLDATRDEAAEQLRLAQNRWRQLAGPDADPHDPDRAVRAHDPQLAYDTHVAEASPTVRTVAAFHRSAQARWKVLWAAVGQDQPPAPEDLHATLDGILGFHRRAQAELRRLEAAETRAAARMAACRPIVLVEPRVWIAPGPLAQLLSSIPPEGQVVLVERAENQVS